MPTQQRPPPPTPLTPTLSRFLNFLFDLTPGQRARAAVQAPADGPVVEAVDTLHHVLAVANLTENVDYPQLVHPPLHLWLEIAGRLCTGAGTVAGALAAADLGLVTGDDFHTLTGAWVAAGNPLPEPVGWVFAADLDAALTLAAAVADSLIPPPVTLPCGDTAADNLFHLGSNGPALFMHPPVDGPGWVRVPAVVWCTTHGWLTLTVEQYQRLVLATELECPPVHRVLGHPHPAGWGHRGPVGCGAVVVPVRQRTRTAGKVTCPACLTCT